VLISRLQALLADLLAQEGINDPRLDRIQEILQRLREGGELTDEDREFLEGLQEDD
jgi:hypothetical protein